MSNIPAESFAHLADYMDRVREGVTIVLRVHAPGRLYASLAASAVTVQWTVIHAGSGDESIIAASALCDVRSATSIDEALRKALRRLTRLVIAAAPALCDGTPLAR